MLLIVRSLLIAGVDTTVHALSAVLQAFATQPGQWQRLREDPGSARVASDEAVRREPPVPGRGEPGPRRWDDPDTFDLAREPSRRHHNNTLRAWGSLPVRVVL
ncbi:cytochrome P450 [Amycolatopsis lexingtonensis]|uniref:Cytochrome P450 n=1 Tax=Amycolatopsis lexingtonensis TaxID=218822 RepID=A0ABR9IHK4_9PSEU|nr:hypothetical protein [Amycolatopsis lexingtonensis]MBE1502645.1 cytochrome P450 [Amycolatopsis lexingtonensis]